VDATFDGARSPTKSWLDYVRTTTVLFWAVHLAAVGGVLYYGWSWRGLALATGAYFVRMFAVTAGYHRYFAHRSFKTSRLFQLVLAVGAQSAAQKGVIWWASHHRWHHKYSDTARDVHSPVRRGFWYAHLGWIASSTWTETNVALASDLTAFPELRFLNHSGIDILPVVALALAFLFIGGGRALVWGFFVSTVLLWHGAFAINSVCHLFGSRRYATTDGSRNNWLLALLATGEGWHNNHHHYQSSAKQGFRWWEIDVTYYLLCLFELLGVIWDLRRPPRGILESGLEPSRSSGPS
jgi:stearoyl-CoA desaturase (Delta-9 desaturase)